MALSDRIRQRDLESHDHGAVPMTPAGASRAATAPDGTPALAGTSRLLPRDLAWVPLAMDSLDSRARLAPETVSHAATAAGELPRPPARPDRRLHPSDLQAFMRARAANADGSAPLPGAHTVERRCSGEDDDADEPGQLRAEDAGRASGTHRAPGAHRTPGEQRHDGTFERRVAQLQAQWQERVEAARAEGFREGMRVARDDHESSMQQQARDAAARQAELLAGTERELDRLRTALCDRLLEVAVHTGAAVACRAIDEHRQRIAFVLDRLFATLVEDFRVVELIVHPDDEAAARAWLEPGMTGRTLTVRSDASLRPGGLLARVDDSVVDACVQQRIRHAFDAFGLPPTQAKGIETLLVPDAADSA